MSEHKEKRIDGFAKKYKLAKLVYFEKFPEVNDAISAEKKIKGWRRSRKYALIRSKNPQFQDLAKYFGR